MGSQMRKVLLVLAGLVLFAGPSWAKSPFEKVAGIGGPLDGLTQTCFSIQVDSGTTAEQVFPARADRIGFTIVNVSSQTSAVVTGDQVYGESDPVVFITTASALSLPGGLPDWPKNLNSPSGPLYPCNDPGDVACSFNSAMVSGSGIFQGALFAISNSTHAYIQGCELRP